MRVFGMKKLLCLLLLVSCNEGLSVNELGKDKWQCQSPKGRFLFSGEGAQEKAHKRCDSFLLPYEKTDK